MTKEEAQKVLNESRQRFFGNRFCPVMKEVCAQHEGLKCQAYEEGAIVEIAPGDFRYRPAACLSLVVSCYIEVAKVD